MGQVRRSRMCRQSSGRPVALTARDVEIFRLLRRYRYLRSTFIHAFVGGDRTKLVERLGQLYHDGGFVDRPQQQWQSANARHQPVVYALSEKGATVVNGLGQPVDAVAWPVGRGKSADRQFLHTLLICEILASIELGMRTNKHLRFVTWPEILRHPYCPEQTHGSGPPFAIATSNHGAGAASTSRQTHIIPDAVFGIEYAGGVRNTYRFFALEADRGTMPVVRTTRRQSDYRTKLRGYQDIIARQRYRSQFGLPNLFVLTVTTSEARKMTILKAIADSACDARVFLIKATPQEAVGAGLLYPSPDLLTEPWERADETALTIAS